jgi:hypothetical protein
MNQSRARHDPRTESPEDEVTGLRAPRPEHEQGGKPRRLVDQPTGDDGVGPEEPDDGEFELIGDDDLGATDLGPAAPNYHDPDAGSGRVTK